MVINRDKKIAKVLSYTQLVDDYGQLRQETPTERTIEVVVRGYRYTLNNDPRYNDVEYIALTDDKEITDKNEIQIDNKIYAIVEILNTPRLTRLYLRSK